jgi:hypothetical protein
MIASQRELSHHPPSVSVVPYHELRSFFMPS